MRTATTPTEMEAPRPSWWLLPAEMSDALDALDVHGKARVALSFVAGCDSETFARAVAYAAPDALPARIRALVDSTGGESRG